MSAIFGKSTRSPSKPAATGLTLQTSSNAVPVPLVWGQARMAPNLIWYDDFKARKEKVGGKGGGGGQEVYKYSASVMMALCEGPIDDINNVWRDLYLKETKNSFKTTYGSAEFVGSYSQSAWSYLTTNHPDAAIPYRGVAYIAIPNYNLDDNPSLPQHNMEINGLLYQTAVNGTTNDAEPAALVEDFLTNENYGTPFNPSALDQDSLFSGPNATTTGDSAYETYCRAMGFGLSPALADAETASGILERWLQLTNTAPVWSGNLLKFIPYGDDDITANGVTFLAVNDVRFDLTEDDFQYSDGEDPVQFNRSDATDAKNAVFVEITDRDNEYALSPIPAKDQASIEIYGLKQMDTVSAHEIKDPVMGDKIAHLLLNRMAYLRNEFTFRLTYKYVQLEAMDIVTLTDSTLGITEFPVRIISVEESDNGFLDIVAEEYFGTLGSTGTYSTQSSENVVYNWAAAPGDVDQTMVFEPPAALTNGNPEVWIAASGSGEYWGGCNVWLSTDNTSYYQIGTILNEVRMGELAAALPAYASSNPDTTNTLEVDLSDSLGELDSGTASDAANGVTLCYVDGELLSYEDATLTGSYTYDLDNLYRGLYGTTADLHAIATQFVRLDDTIFKYELPEEYVGETLYLKFQSFNIWATSQQDISTLTPETYTPTGVAWDLDAPTGVTITPSAVTLPDGSTSIELGISWTASGSSLIDRYDVQVEVNGSGTWKPAPSAAGDETSSVFSSGVQASTNYRARVRAVRTSGRSVTSDWATSASTSSGAVATSAPSSAGTVSGTGGTGGNQIEWVASSSDNVTGYKIYAVNNHTGAFGTASLVGTVARGTLTFWHGGLASESDWRYWVVAYNSAGDATESGPLDLTTSASGGGGGGVDVEDDGTPVDTATTLDFIGFTVTDNGSGNISIESTGGGGGGGTSATIPPSYLNRYGSDGARYLEITASITSGGYVGNPNAGLEPDERNVWYWSGGDTSAELQWEFPKAVLITGIYLIQSTATSQGTWDVEGSDNGSTWTTIASGLSWSASTDVEMSFSNSTSYKYYRLAQVGGTTSSTPYQRSQYFKIEQDAVASPGQLEWDLLASGTFSGEAAVDVADLDDYEEVFVFIDERAVSASSQMMVQVSTDNGSTFFTTSGDYRDISTSGIDANAEGAIMQSSASGGVRSGVANIMGMNGTGTYKRILTNDTSSFVFLGSTDPINAIRFTNTAGTMSSGDYYFYGRKASTGRAKGYSMTYSIDSATTFTDAGLSFVPGSSGALGDWSIFNGTETTVDLYTVGTGISANRYDFTTRPGAMLLQPDNSSGVTTSGVGLHVSDTLADGETIITKMNVPNLQTSGNNYLRAGISLTTSATGPDSGTYAMLYWDGSNINDILLYTGAIIGAAPEAGNPGGPNYFRITRTGGYYWFFHSVTGEVWTTLGRLTDATAYDQIFVWAGNGNTIYTSDTCPIFSIEWVRHVASTALDVSS